MRPLVLLVLTPLLANARVCGSAASSEATPIAPAAVVSVNAAMPPVASKHGGTVVTVDDVQLELLVKGDGQVVAYPVQNAAAPAAAPTLQANAQVTVAVPVQTGGTAPVQLVWSPVQMRFVGQVQGATVVTTRPNDVEVTVVSDGRRRHRRVERVVFVDATPRVEVVRPRPLVQVQVVTPPPPVVRVEVQRPLIDVRIGGGVRVDGDRYHDEHRGREHHDNGLHLGQGGGHGGGHGHGMH